MRVVWNKRPPMAANIGDDFSWLSLFLMRSGDWESHIDTLLFSRVSEVEEDIERL